MILINSANHIDADTKNLNKLVTARPQLDALARQHAAKKIHLHIALDESGPDDSRNLLILPQPPSAPFSIT